MIETLTAIAEAGDGEAMRVWPINWSIVTAFLAICSQWRAITLANGGIHWVGLDYGAAAAGLELAGIKVSPEDWGWVRVMERAAQQALNGFRG